MSFLSKQLSLTNPYSDKEILPTIEDYLLFYNRSNEDVRVIGSIQKELRHWLARRECATRFEKKLTMLEIGPGDGRKTTGIVRFLEKRGYAVSIDIIEPEKSCATAFKKHLQLSSCRSELRSVSSKRWDSFVSSVPNENYDIILCTHSSYDYISQESDLEDAAELLRATVSHLTASGLMLLVVGDRKNSITHLRNFFFYGEDIANRITALSCSISHIHPCPSVRIQKRSIDGQTFDVSDIIRSRYHGSSALWNPFVRFILHLDPFGLSEQDHIRFFNLLLTITVFPSTASISEPHGSTDSYSNEIYALPVNDDLFVLTSAQQRQLG